ncbi:MAG: hypothetical protein KatS3mg010_0998 [Acidimicrobiia bacterium]|nr:MAG: hypothetical protein KatS3mg010_0998 [Acidimicrobiia bacterium]
MTFSDLSAWADDETTATAATAAAPVVAARGPALDDRPARFIAAARELANETGTAAFTVAQVAQRARLSLKSFYRCFRGKDELLLALLRDDSGLGAQILRERTANVAEPLRTYVDVLFELATDPAAVGYAGILVREHRRLSDVDPLALDHALAPLTDLLADLVGTEDARRDAHTMLGVLIAGIHDVLSGRVANPSEHARYLYRFCTRGLEG